MRFRPASINYLVDASSHHIFDTGLPTLVVQRLQDGERRDEEDEDVDDGDEEEMFELRSAQSGDSDDFHLYCDDDNGSTTDTLVRYVVYILLDISEESNKTLSSLQKCNLIPVTDEIVALPSRALEPAKRLVKTLKVFCEALSPPALILRVRWYIFLNQRRQFVAFEQGQDANDDVTYNDTRYRRTDCNNLIPLPFLKMIQAIMSISKSEMTALQRTPTKAMPKINYVQPIQASLTPKCFNVTIRSQLVAESVTHNRPQESQPSQDGKRRIEELVTENKRLRQVNRHPDPIEIVNRSQICEVTPTPGFHQSPARSGASTVRIIASIVDENGGKFDTRLSFDEVSSRQCPALSRKHPTPHVEPSSKAQRIDDQSITDNERTTKRLSFESPSETWSNSFPTRGHDLEFPSRDDESYLDQRLEMSNEVFETEDSSRRDEAAPEKKQKKEKKHKKTKKKKKEKRIREVEGSGSNKKTVLADTSASPTTGCVVSKITPETRRGKGKLRSNDPCVEIDACFDPRVKPYNPVNCQSRF